MQTPREAERTDREQIRCERNGWDWTPGTRAVTPQSFCREGVAWLEEPVVSPDGERVARVAALEEGGFSLCVNGELLSEDGQSFDKLWLPRFAPDCRLTALVQTDGLWTLAVENQPWEESWDFAWGTRFAETFDGRSAIAVSVQSGGEYGMAVDGQPWETLFANANQFALGANGHGAAAVQVAPLGSADLDGFQAGVFSLAVDGEPWDARFVNVWAPVLDSRPIQDGGNPRAACAVRLNLYEYSAAVDGDLWPERYQCVWEPVFHPMTGQVAIPARQSGRWGLAARGEWLWKPEFAQLWQAAFSTDGQTLAAIASPLQGRFGLFTVVVNGQPWKVLAPTVTDLTIAPAGNGSGVSVAALFGASGESNVNFSVVRDGRVWGGNYDMARRPVFSPDGERLAVAVEKNGRQTIVLDDRTYGEWFDQVLDPVFSPDGGALLIRARSGEVWLRTVAPLRGPGPDGFRD